MAITTPLTLKSTKGMLEMQRLAPEMRKLQNEYRNDRTKLNEEMMKLYQEHKVNPMASCLPIAGADAGLLHHVPGAARPGVSARPAQHQPVSDAVLAVRSAAPTWHDPGFIPRYLRDRLRAVSSRCSASSRDAVARPRPVEVGG